MSGHLARSKTLLIAHGQRDGDLLHQKSCTCLAKNVAKPRRESWREHWKIWQACYLRQRSLQQHTRRWTRGKPRPTTWTGARDWRTSMVQIDIRSRACRSSTTRLGEREGGVKVELKPRAGRTEGLGGIRGFLAFLGRIRTRGGPFRVLSGTRRPSKIHPLPRV